MATSLSLVLFAFFALVCLFPAVFASPQEGGRESEYGTIIGIDFGTTHSRVAVQLDDRVEIISNNQGHRMTPSWVSFTEDERLVGDSESAKNAFYSNPKSTVFDAKRLIGRNMEDSELKRDIKHWPFDVVDKGGKPAIQINYKNETREFTPEEISAMVLTKMKETAEAYLGDNVTHAVVTVPAYFNDAQRQATKEAGAIAGLKVLRTMNEPAAAALAYGLDRELGESHIIVYDLGGGTFDVSLLLIDDGVIDILAIAGDTHLGGQDFDSRVIDYFVKLYKEKTGTDVTGNLRAMNELKREVEKAKHALSTQQSTRIEIESFADGNDFSETLTRAKFEELNMDFFQKTMVSVELVLKEANVTKEDVDEVILVGGSTHIPKVQQLLKEYFNGKEPSKGINPDEAVAYGAAVLGGILSSECEFYRPVELSRLTLGVETTGGVLTELIPRMTIVPTRKSQIFSTAADNQSTVLIQVYEGERALTQDNNFLGEFELSGIPPAPRGVPQIEVTFEIDVNSTLTVSAVDKGTGKSESIAIANLNEQGRLSPEDYERMLWEGVEYEASDEAARKRMETLNQLSSFTASTKTLAKIPRQVSPVMNEMDAASDNEPSHNHDEL